MQKVQVDINAVTTNGTSVVKGSVHDSGVGTFESGADPGGADDDASTRGVASPSDQKKELDPGPPIPTIRISSESDRDKEEGVGARPNGDASAATAAAEDTLGKPEQAAAQEEGDDTAGDTATLNGGEAFSFSNKRLCERWLDNLFMVLYEVRTMNVRVWHYLKAALPAGSADMDNLPCRGRSLQNAACSVPQDRRRVGDLGRSWCSTAPQGGG
jgi:Chs5-Arf1p-binding protein BUD7/BCH1